MTLAILGAGAWGTALALAAARAGQDVRLWGRGAIPAAGLGAPALPSAIRPTNDLAAALDGVEAAILAVPAQTMVPFLVDRVGGLLPETVPVIHAAKGFVLPEGALLTEAVARHRPGQAQAVLSGPSFAAEVMEGLPAALTLAAFDLALARRLAPLVASPVLRPYVADDPIGAQVGGALKNVVAIACGLVIGLGLGENARAALMTRGLAEMARFAVALGGRPETLMGLAGLGDLALTSSSIRSRNFSHGLGLARGAVKRGPLVEGAATARAAVTRAAALKVELPVAEAVARVLAGDEVETVVQALLARPLRAEHHARRDEA